MLSDFSGPRPGAGGGGPGGGGPGGGGNQVHVSASISSGKYFKRMDTLLNS